MKALLLDIKAAVEQARVEGRTVASAGGGRLESPLCGAGGRGLSSQPTAPPPSRQERTRKQSAARNLLDRLSSTRRRCCFLHSLVVPFDNDYVAYCTPSAWLACFVRRVWNLFVGWRKQRNPTAIGVIHGNATSSPPIPDRLWTHSIGVCGFTGG